MTSYMWRKVVNPKTASVCIHNERYKNADEVNAGKNQSKIWVSRL